uniref:Epiplakin 1 n=1 Tax=Oryzias latipes TaxID=8090 RepID=H2LVA8_ORYLA
MSNFKDKACVKCPVFFPLIHQCNTISVTKANSTAMQTIWFVQQYKTGTITIKQFMDSVLKIVEEQTASRIEKTAVDSSLSNTSIRTTITEVTTFQGIRKDVTASELLQSKIIDENTFKDLSAGKLTVAEISEKDSVRKYLEGTNSIAGVYLQATKETLSIQEAKSRGLLTPGTSLVLLEAQAATGFVIDPVKNKKLSVEEAVAQGVVGKEWKSKLLSAERAVTGYKDPYTGDTISLFQALKKDLIVKDHGIRLLEAQIATGGIIDPVYSHRVPVQVAYERGYFDEEMNQILSDPDDDTKGFFDPNTQENLTYLQLIERCTTDPATNVLKIVEDEKDSVRKYLKGTNSIAGVYLQATKETLSIQEAKSRGLLTPGTSLVLLEAQAATGFVIDPVKNKKLSVEEAVAQGVVGKEWKSKLLSAERAVTGYKDPYTGDTISLFQALKKDLIVKDHGIRLLEAQIATGGIIDPVYSHRVPSQVAYERGYFDEEMNQILSDPDDDTKGFFDPNTQENLTYLQLIERCTTDPITGLCLLPLVK